MAAAGWVGREAAGVQFMWPWAFDTIAATYAERFGLDEAHLHAIGELNLHNAKANPLAQTRAWAIGPIDDDLTNPVPSGSTSTLRLQPDHRRCGRRRAGEPARGTSAGARGLSVVAGWGHRTVGLPLAPKLSTTASAGAIEGDSRRAAGLVMPHVADTVTDAFGRAGVTDVWQLDAIETPTASHRRSTWRLTTSASHRRASPGAPSRTARSNAQAGCPSTRAAA